MVYCMGQRCMIEIECPNADAMKVCGDGLPCSCSMQRRIGHVWFALLILPLGIHHVRYLARFGPRTLCIGQERIAVTDDESSSV